MLFRSNNNNNNSQKAVLASVPIPLSIISAAIGEITAKDIMIAGSANGKKGRKGKRREGKGMKGREEGRREGEERRGKGRKGEKRKQGKGMEGRRGAGKGEEGRKTDGNIMLILILMWKGCMKGRKDLEGGILTQAFLSYYYVCPFLFVGDYFSLQSSHNLL